MRWRALSYMSLVTHVVKEISVVESNNFESLRMGANKDNISAGQIVHGK
jgi:hypothetical protein